MHACVRTCVCACMRGCVHVYMHVYIHVYMLAVGTKLESTESTFPHAFFRYGFLPSHTYYQPACMRACRGCNPMRWNIVKHVVFDSPRKPFTTHAADYELKMSFIINNNVG